jgi:hypothetical protein
MLNDGPTETLITSAEYVISIWWYMDGFSSSITVVVVVLIAVNFSFNLATHVCILD